MATALGFIPNSAIGYEAEIDFSGGDCMGSASLGTDGTSFVEFLQIEGSNGNGGLNKNIGQTYANILGTVKRAGGGALTRSIPMRHPVYRHAFASRIASVTGLGYIGSDPTTRTPVYQRLSIGIVFSVPKYKVLGDGEYDGSELSRFTVRECEPHSEGLGIDISFYFGTVAQGVPTNIATKPFKGAIHQVVSKVLQTLTLVDWPANAAMDDFGWPTQMLPSVGTVNSALYRGVARGCLLFREFKIASKVGALHPRHYGIGPNDEGLNAEVPLLVDTTVALYRFDRGWNSCPAANPDGSNAGWYPVSTKQDGTGSGIYEYSDFAATIGKAL